MRTTGLKTMRVLATTCLGSRALSEQVWTGLMSRGNYQRSDVHPGVPHTMWPIPWYVYPPMNSLTDRNLWNHNLPAATVAEKLYAILSSVDPIIIRNFNIQW